MCSVLLFGLSNCMDLLQLWLDVLQQSDFSVLKHPWTVIAKHTCMWHTVFDISALHIDIDFGTSGGNRTLKTPAWKAGDYDQFVYRGICPFFVHGLTSSNHPIFKELHYANIIAHIIIRYYTIIWNNINFFIYFFTLEMREDSETS